MRIILEVFHTKSYKRMKTIRLAWIILPAFSILLLVTLNSCGDGAAKADITITLAAGAADEPLDGRLLIMIADNENREPRFQISAGASTQLIYGMDVEDWKPGETVSFDRSATGYPLRSMADIPPGDYWIQAFINKYETFNLSTGHTIKMHMDQGEGQQWRSSPGNIYSEPVKVTIGEGGKMKVSMEAGNVIPPIEPAEDTEFIKHVRIESKMLSEFWGRPMYLQANVLVPYGFDPESDTRYPLFVFHGHFPYTFDGFRTTPPDADPNDNVYNSRFRITGYDYIQQKEAYDFYLKWVSPSFPRYVVIEIQHQNPYYDDSYAVNSANLGPYGDAIMYELIPEVEKMFNCVGEGWGRFTYGGSTGGWEALAVQVFYPDEFNGCFAACPDPIDFRAYTVVNIYEDKNAYYLDSRFKKTPRPGNRDYRGHISSTIEEQNLLEYVVGTNSRSGDQWDIWQAVFSPQGDNGYPRPIWDKLTGEIDHEVAEYWKENYDLRYIMERDWDILGPKLKGKIHIYCGDMDNYYLNNAVRLTEDFLESTTDPYYDGVVKYGDGFEHCWNGDPDSPNYLSRLRYNWFYNDIIKERLRKTAPKNHNLVNWGI
jgi:hypothetical protein